MFWAATVRYIHRILDTLTSGPTLLTLIVLGAMVYLNERGGAEALSAGAGILITALTGVGARATWKVHQEGKVPPIEKDGM